MLAGWWFGTFGLFFHILGIIIPTDCHIFQRGWNRQPDVFMLVYDIFLYCLYRWYSHQSRGIQTTSSHLWWFRENSVLPSRIYAHTESVLVMEVAAGDSLSNFIKQNHSKEKRSLDQLWLWINSYENTILGGMNIYIHIKSFICIFIYIYMYQLFCCEQTTKGFSGFWPIPKWCHMVSMYGFWMPQVQFLWWSNGHCDIGNFRS